MKIVQEILSDPSDDDINKVRKNLQDYNIQHIEIKSKDTYVVNLHDQNLFIGGLVCTHVGKWIELDFLWIHENYRKYGLGKRLIGELENLAEDLKCSSLSTTTFNFQAKPFYEASGFKVVYTQRNYPITSTKYFMEKHLK